MPRGKTAMIRRLLGRRPTQDVVFILRYAASLRKPRPWSLRRGARVTTSLLFNSLLLDVFAMRNEVGRKCIQDCARLHSLNNSDNSPFVRLSENHGAKRNGLIYCNSRQITGVRLLALSK